MTVVAAAEGAGARESRRAIVRRLLLEDEQRELRRCRLGARAARAAQPAQEAQLSLPRAVLAVPPATKVATVREGRLLRLERGPRRRLLLLPRDSDGGDGGAEGGGVGGRRPNIDECGESTRPLGEGSPPQL